ncbi:MAG TPA: type II secretion system protein GspM [Usitatibacter sp.]|jgi:general secretion pathway protein M|nr:type II secretion system protein GspM [Usitatibacter sp.]
MSSRPFASLSPERSRAVAVGLLVVVVVAIVAAVAVPVWMRHRYYDLALADSAAKYDRFRRIAGTRPEVARELEAMRAKDTRRFFLRSGAAALSAAESQEALRALIEQSGGRLITMNAPTAKDEGRYRQISVNVQLTANIFALRKILHAIENNTPFLFVDSLQVRTQVPPNFHPQPGQEPEMFVMLDVSGYALTGS